MQTHIMGYRKIIIMAVFSLLVFQTNAGPVDEHVAYQKALDFMNSRGVSHINTKGGKQVSRVKVKSNFDAVAEHPEYYVFSSTDGTSFVVVSGEDSMPEIVCYSFGEAPAEGSMPPAMVDYLDSYSKVVNAVRCSTAQIKRTESEGVAVAPLLTTKWNQNTPFNNLCAGSSGTVYCAGCVPVAMAQVMKYHNFPASGKGKTNSCKADWDDEIAGVDLSTSIYDWENMIDNYNGDYTEKEASAVALLMRDCGFSIMTKYGTSSSSAYTFQVPYALARYFNYSKGARYLKRSSVTTEEWIAVIRDNLLKGQPVIYGADTGINHPIVGGMFESGGHAMVCDGIDENNYLHINWGWGGNYDGYFDMEVLSPIYSDNYLDGIKCNHHIVCDICPGDPDADNTSYYKEILINKWYLEEGTKVEADGKTKAYSIYYNFVNVSNRDSVSYTLGLYSKSGELIGKFSERKIDKINPNVSMVTSVSVTSIKQAIHGFGNFDEIPDGDYYITSTDDRVDFACESQFNFSVKGGEIYVDPTTKVEKGSNKFELIDVKYTSAYARVQCNNLKLRLRNVGEKSYGNLNSSRIWFVPIDQDTADTPVLDPYINVVGDVQVWGYDQVEIETKADVTSYQPGKYSVYIAYPGTSKVIPSAQKYYVEVLPTPTDKPFALRDNLQTERGVYDNSGTQQLKVFIPYWYLYDKIMGYRSNFEIWAYPADGNKEDARRLIGPVEKIAYSGSDCEWEISGTLQALQWEKPGEYNIFLKWGESSNNMIEYDDPCNFGTFTLVGQDYDLVDDLHLVEPMVINGGNPVVSGEVFDVKFRIGTRTGISIIPEQSYFMVKESPWNSKGYIGQCEVEIENPTMEAGEESDVAIKAKVSVAPSSRSVTERYVSIFVAKLAGKDYYKVMAPREYLESAYFTIEGNSGVSDIIIDDCEMFRVDGKTLVAQGLTVGSLTEVISVTGMVVHSFSSADAFTHYESLAHLPVGIYIVRNQAADGCHISRILLR